MPDDLPPIDTSLDAPLPDVPPDSALVPYRLSRTEPGGQPIVTTGYGPRARPAVQPPVGMGGGVGMPDLDRIYQSAFSNLPVEQASKAVEAAMRYQGQRGYMRDLQGGMNAAQAFAKWGPMLFHQATGIPEAIMHSVPPPITPFQQQQLALRKQQVEAQAAAAKAKAEAATRMTPYQQAQIDLKKSAATKAPAMAPEKKAELTDAEKQLDEARKDMAKLVQNPPGKSKSDIKKHQDSMDDATMRMRDARLVIAKFNPASQTPAVAPADTIPNPAQTKTNPYKVGAQYGKLVYKGGDPNLEASWQPVK